MTETASSHSHDSFISGSKRDLFRLRVRSLRKDPGEDGGTNDWSLSITCNRMLSAIFFRLF